MKVKDLIYKSSDCLGSDVRTIEQPLAWNLFGQGGEWMRAWLEEWDPDKTADYRQPIAFNTYGVLKYLICVSALPGSAYGFYRIDPWLLPLSVIVFYIVEVHFLFLFPLLIDGVKNPLWKSIVITHRIGLFYVLANVIPIGFFMIWGLFRFSDPLRNWYKGCLAILIWYQHDVRNRI